MTESVGAMRCYQDLWNADKVSLAVCKAYKAAERDGIIQIDYPVEVSARSGCLLVKYRSTMSRDDLKRALRARAQKIQEGSA